MNIEIFTLCDAATESGGKLNILGAFDSLIAPGFPVVHPQCAVALRLRFRRIERGEHRLVLHLVDEDGNLILPPLDSTIGIQIPNNEPSATINLVLNLQNLKIEHPGEFAINIAIDGRQEASLPLFVKQVIQTQLN